ncbi:MAG: hypothetical protein AAF999_07945 [Pseudomonadota bacterium]
MTPHPNLLRVNQLPCDAFERALLPVLRHHLNDYADPRLASGHRAFVVAVERWGEPIGLSVAFHLQKLVRAILQCRPEGLEFHDPLCLDSKEAVTDDERLLIDMLHHMRRDQTARARDRVYQITDGRMDPDVIRTGLQFAQRFACGVSGEMRPRAAKPILKVVR